MRTYRYLIFLLLIFPIMPNASSQKEFNSDVSSWVENKRPSSAMEIEWINWNYSVANSSVDWVVSLINGKVTARIVTHTFDFQAPSGFPQIVLSETNKKIIQAQKIEDGWLVAFHKKGDEGDLWWYSPDGKDNYQITKALVRNFLATDDGIYLMEAGYSNDSLIKGSLQKIAKTVDGRWKLVLIVPTEDSPVVGVELSKKTLVFASKPSGLYLVDRQYRLEKIIGMDDLYHAYANSMVAAQNDKYVYIGARQYVIEINLHSRSVKYLVPSRDFVECHVDEVNMKSYLKDRYEETTFCPK